MQYEPKNLLQPKPPAGLRKNLKPFFEKGQKTQQFLTKKRPLEELRSSMKISNTPDFGKLSVLEKSNTPRESKEKLNTSTAA